MTPEDRLRKMMATARGGERPASESEWEEFRQGAHRSVRTQRVAGAALAVILLAGGIGGGALLIGGSDGGGVPPAEGPVDSPTTTPTVDDEPPPPPDEDPPPSVEREIWLVNPKPLILSWGTRVVPGGDPLSSTLNELLRGPNVQDAEAGISTAIPKGTKLLEASTNGGVADINLSERFDDPDGGPGTMRLREAQVVFTATQFDDVERVRIFVEGEPYLDRVDPVGRDDYDDVAPSIVVESPLLHAEVTSPLVVSGTADVFEATVSTELLIGKGKGAEKIEGFATATCGTGCRGDFETTIEFEVDRPTAARLTVFESSAEDGSRLGVVSLPVTLLPD